MPSIGRRAAIGTGLAAFGVPRLTLADEDTFTFGAIGTLSGSGTAWGLAIQRGAALAIDEANQSGGLKVGEKTWRVANKMYDDQYTGQGGKSAAERLVYQDKVKFIVGPIGSNPVLSTIEVTTPAKVLVMGDGYSPAILRNPQHAPFNFRFTLTNLEYTPKMLAWVTANLPVKKVGILVPNDAIGQAVAPALIQAYKDAGLETISESFERGSQEFTPLIARLMARGMDGFDINFNAPGDAGLMVRQARDAGYDKIIYQMGGPSVPEIMEIAGDAAEGSYPMKCSTSLRQRGKSCPPPTTPNTAMASSTASSPPSIMQQKYCSRRSAAPAQSRTPRKFAMRSRICRATMPAFTDR